MAAKIMTLLATSALCVDIEALRKQAIEGDAEAQFSLGVIIESGQVVPQDHTEATNTSLEGK